MSTPIAEYLEEMRLRRDPPPAAERMSREAGLSPTAIKKILSGRSQRPRKDTIKKICDRWGDEEGNDYLIMMKLAGYSVMDESHSRPAREVIASMRDYSHSELLEIADAAIRRARERFAQYGGSLDGDFEGSLEDNRGKSPGESDSDSARP